MRFLLDENLSPKVAAPLRAAGHDVTIAREVGLRTATDQVVIETARREARVLISADTDIGAILALSGAATPSFVLVRRAANRRPDEQAALILNNLETVVTDLAAGAIVVLGETTLRIHRLPTGEDSSPLSPVHPHATDCQSLTPVAWERPGCRDEGEPPSTENHQAQQVKLD
jgi:predicted nuclease of predicted toxin-antitoxin system